ncbi:discoidin domain-containing protein [Paenibacillus rubinfantis]|uniref:discoidin domain-containing protein n=1 Tax=Paenibacillus rubinfantis TaxID=1720296 RepID=UPI00073EB860|nr:discoidin domain-containing protein [Paenibacillus rubinfantis]
MIRKVISIISSMVIAASLFSIGPSYTGAAPIGDANATIFGPNVYVFDPTMPASDIQNVVNDVFAVQERNEFGSERTALLFKPGSYNLNFNVGFNTHVAGLGQNPGDVNINGGLNVNADWDNGNATRNFWRTIENLTISPSSGTTQIAVSQAAPLRRLHIKGQLDLFDFDSNWNAGWASGGFLADSIVDGLVVPASQQQWLSRNSQWSSWNNGVWNMVFVGSNNAPAGQFPDPPYTVVPKTPVIREKPYLFLNNAGQYQVFVPSLQRDTQGVSWASGNTPGTAIPLDQFYIAKPDTATAASINSALGQGKHLLFTPGFFHLDDTIRITNPNTVVLGIGIPTLVPDNGQPAMTVADVDGVKIAGLTFDAGPVKTPVLLEVGPAGSSVRHATNPTSLHDLTFRIGGFANGQTDVGVQINSDDVVADHFWIWRADHGAGAGWTSNVSKNGLVVNGDAVTIYGLFNEHHNEYQTLWNGNGGRVYFYQSEIPYDVPNQSAWMSQGGIVNGYASYKVADSVTTHEAWGLGIYSYFRDATVKLNSAIEVPDVPGVKLHHATTVWLNGTPGSEITHVVNDAGGRVYANSPSTAMRQTLTEYPANDSGETALIRNGWTATSTPSSSEAAANLLDGSLDTRWTTGVPMAPGQSLVIDMKTANEFTKIVMDSTGSNDDYARGYEIYVSNDGLNWGSAIAAGSGSGPAVSVTFAPQHARYIQVVQTGTASNWWSIREVNVFR